MQSTALGQDQLVNFTTRVRDSVRRRLRVYAAEHDEDLQNVVDAALDAYLRDRGS